MVESTKSGFPSQYTVSMFSNDSVLAKAATEFAQLASQNGTVPESLTEMVKTPSLSSVVTREEVALGSASFADLIRKTKLLFLKTAPVERVHLETLRLLGLPTVTYGGALIFDPSPYYLIATVPGESINLSKVLLCDNSPKESYDTFDVLSMAATFLAKLHRQEWIHGNFKVGSFLLSSNPPSPITIYRVPALHKIQSKAEKTAEIATFLDSLKDINLNCPHDSYREFFTRTYETV